MFNLFYYLFPQEYKVLFDGAGNNPGEKTLEDKFFEYEVGYFSNDMSVTPLILSWLMF